MTLKNFSASRWLWLFIIVHIACWTLAPYFVRYNLPMDALEGNLWGHQLALGYDKNPYMNAWLTAFTVYLSGYSSWMIYLFSQTSVALCFWAVWKIANKILTPIYALFSVMILECMQYYNFHSIDFNDNTLELSLWALCAYFFYEALQAKQQFKKYSFWILTGLFAGFGLMAKYYTLVLLAGMGLFVLCNAENRRALLSPAIYAGLLAMLIVVLPHIIWLFSHEFITITYVFDRAASVPTWTNHLFFPAQFAWQQFEVLLPALIVFALLFIGHKPLLATPRKISTFNAQFLFYVGVMPILLTLTLSLFTGTKLRAGWGMPLLSLWGIILFALLSPRLSASKVYSFIAGIFILMGMFVSAYCLSLIHSDDASSANFPGKEIATTITNEWHARYHTTLSYVAGSRWLCSNVVYYSPDHPTAFTEWDTKRSFWVDMDEMKKKGAVFVWDVSNYETLPSEVAAQFPTLSKITTMQFAYHRNPNLPPIILGVAFLPAAQHQT